MTFIERPKRFIAYCDIDGAGTKVHVKNTGRGREGLPCHNGINSGDRRHIRQGKASFAYDCTYDSKILIDEGMSMKDKNRVRYEGGFFVLMSNVDTTLDRLLDLYYGRTEIETVFLTAKENLKLLPLTKQEEEMVRGKIMQDIIALITYLQIRKRTAPTGRSVSDYIYDLQSVMAYRDDADTVKVEFVNKQAKAAYNLLDAAVPASISVSVYRKSLYLSV